MKTLTLKGKTILITGGSAGIGKATARRVAKLGATVIIVARNQENLDATQQEFAKKGLQVTTYAVDLCDETQSLNFIANFLAKHGAPDILVNNAGRSIRRSIKESYERFHDFERTMNVNYFAALRLILGFLPAMAARKSGHIINISSIAVLTRVPRFSAYIASKSALDSFTRCAESEYAHQGISFSTINMPLVRTAMIAPTKIYKNSPALSVNQAADKILYAIEKRTTRIATSGGLLVAFGQTFFPKSTQRMLNVVFRLSPNTDKPS